MARKKIREYHSKRLLKEHLKRLASIDLQILSAQVSIHQLFNMSVLFCSVLNLDSSQVTESTDFTELTDQHPWLSSTRLVVKPDMLFGKRGKSGLVALNLDIAQVAEFVKARLGVEVWSPKTKTKTFRYFVWTVCVLDWTFCRLRWEVARRL